MSTDGWLEGGSVPRSPALPQLPLHTQSADPGQVLAPGLARDCWGVLEYPGAAWMKQSEAPADSHGGWAPGELHEQLGPQETLSILPSTKWDHSLSSLWGRAGRRGRGVQECTLSPQYAAKAVGTTARFALSLGAIQPWVPPPVWLHRRDRGSWTSALVSWSPPSPRETHCLSPALPPHGFLLPPQDSATEGTAPPSQWKFTPTAQPSCLQGGGWGGTGSSCRDRRLHERVDRRTGRRSPGLHL